MEHLAGRGVRVTRYVFASALRFVDIMNAPGMQNLTRQLMSDPTVMSQMLGNDTINNVANLIRQNPALLQQVCNLSSKIFGKGPRKIDLISIICQMLASNPLFANTPGLQQQLQNAMPQFLNMVSVCISLIKFVLFFVLLKMNQESQTYFCN